MPMPTYYIRNVVVRQMEEKLIDSSLLPDCEYIDGIRPNDQKTKIVNAYQDSFDFLGFRFQMRRSPKREVVPTH
ncbi:hypothetical protein [Desulfobacter vibrioformis]|uniref:hypothetical protein n=1 Tax=Desulfobacter vibrioformis TaxID=34031 RepID=UPI00054E6ACE|nr:hypothetical protein [Desulfobacter vibrioformis]